MSSQGKRGKQLDSFTMYSHDHNSSGLTLSAFNQRKLTESKQVINRQASILDENRIVLYKKGKQMGTGYYIVEISSSVSHVYITAFNVEKPQSLVL